MYRLILSLLLFFLSQFVSMSQDLKYKVNSVAYSADGKTAYVLGNNFTIKKLSLPSWETSKTYTLSAPKGSYAPYTSFYNSHSNSLAQQAVGRYLVIHFQAKKGNSSADISVLLFDVEKGEFVRSDDKNFQFVVAAVGDKYAICNIGNKKLQLMDISSGALVHELASGAVMNYFGSKRHVYISADGKALTDFEDKGGKVIETETNKTLVTFAPASAKGSVWCAPAGKDHWFLVTEENINGNSKTTKYLLSNSGEKLPITSGSAYLSGMDKVVTNYYHLNGSDWDGYTLLNKDGKWSEYFVNPNIGSITYLGNWISVPGTSELYNWSRVGYGEKDTTIASYLSRIDFATGKTLGRINLITGTAMTAEELRAYEVKRLKLQEEVINKPLLDKQAEQAKLAAEAEAIRAEQQKKQELAQEERNKMLEKYIGNTSFTEYVINFSPLVLPYKLNLNGLRGRTITNIPFVKESPQYKDWIDREWSVDAIGIVASCESGLAVLEVHNRSMDAGARMEIKLYISSYSNSGVLLSRKAIGSYYKDQGGVFMMPDFVIEKTTGGYKVTGTQKEGDARKVISAIINSGTCN